MKRVILTCLVILTSGVTLFFIAVLASRLQMNYNEQGIYFDEETFTTYNSQALIFINLATVVALLLSASLILWLKNLPNKNSHN
jgi:hypothetical protein